MGVTVGNSTMIDCVTPICNSCGVCLCYDIGDTEYAENKSFWDDWRCADCDPRAKGSFMRFSREAE
jgi:hypothetical protein